MYIFNCFLLNFNSILIKSHDTSKFGNEQIIDIDGDGNKDKINCILVNNSKLILCVNDEKLEMNARNTYEGFAVVNIDKKTKEKIILLSDLGGSDDYTTRYYSYSDKNIKYMGETGGLYNEGIIFNGTEKFKVYSRGSSLQTWFFYKSYNIDPISNKVLLIPQDTYKTSYDLFLKKDLIVYQDRDDKSHKKLIKGIQKVTIIETDNKLWYMIEASNGKKGWFRSEGHSTHLDNNESLFDVFYGLCYAD